MVEGVWGGVYGCCIMTVLDRRMHQCISAYLCVWREGKRCPTAKQFICLPPRRTAVITWGGCWRRGTYSNCSGCLLCPRLPNAICDRGENDFCTVDTFCALMVSASLHLKSASLFTAHSEPTAFYREIARNETPHSVTFFSLQNIQISFSSRRCFFPIGRGAGGGGMSCFPPFFFHPLCKWESNGTVIS